MVHFRLLEDAAVFFWILSVTGSKELNFCKFANAYMMRAALLNFSTIEEKVFSYKVTIFYHTGSYLAV